MHIEPNGELRPCTQWSIPTGHVQGGSLRDSWYGDATARKIRGFERSHVLITSDDPAELAPLEAVERRYILRVMEAVGGNKTLAARVLGVGRKTLYRKLEQYKAGGGS